ncbi:MAG: hypothetical protein ACFNLD_10640 [Kingella oralis]
MADGVTVLVGKRVAHPTVWRFRLPNRSPAVATGFVQAGDLQDVDAWKNAKSAQSVAEYGYQAMQRGELVAFNEAKLKFASDWVLPLLPRKTVLKMSRMAMEKRK